MARAAVAEETDGRARGKRGAGRKGRISGVDGRTGDAERIRLREVLRPLGKLDLSPEEEEAVERFSRHLVERLLCGPMFRTMARAGARDGAGGTGRAVEQQMATPPADAWGPEASPQTAEAMRPRYDLRVVGKGASTQ